jgi:D-alanyl-lipoteichoic acid acyltransferase DltB (MBOAT superfamily)
VLFNSFAFVLVFLPLVWAVFLAVRRRRAWAGAAWLLAASLFFYGWWHPPYLALLGASILANFGIGRAVEAARAAGQGGRARATVAAGVALNLGGIAWFKYAGFLWENLAALAGTPAEGLRIVLPLAISFFTFQQIAYLVDVHRGEPAERSLLHYALFVSFFPQLVAGPIVSHRTIREQLAAGALGRSDPERVARGATLFVIGLFKKVMIADTLAPFAGEAFDPGLLAAGAVDAGTAWLGVLAYGLQIYFDFSGYSDMALGLGWLFNLRLPVNFDSPYKAASVVEFWRRWHITLSSFLRDYLYVPLGGNRGGTARQFRNLATTMLLGGLWHGAGWTFVLWGALHGVYLIANHAFRRVRHGLLADVPSGRVTRALARATTLAAVFLAWIPFRAEDPTSALAVARALGAGGFAAGAAAHAAGFGFVALAAAVALAAPNSLEIVERIPVRSGEAADPARVRRWGMALGAATALCLMHLSQPSEFLYFNF